MDLRANMKYFLGSLVFIQLIVILLLLARVRVAEQMTTNIARGHLVAEVAKMNVFLLKLDSGELEVVKDVMQSTISNNMSILQRGVYGDLDMEQREALNTVIKQQTQREDQ